MAQRSKVIQLYKTLLYMGRDYPKGYDYFRKRLKRAFEKNKTERDAEKIEKMLAHVNEINTNKNYGCNRFRVKGFYPFLPLCFLFLAFAVIQL